MRQRCDRIQEWISLEVDDELSRIERALVDRHVAACADCAAFGAHVQAFTAALRDAPLEPLEQPIALPSRRRVPLRSFQVGAAAALAVVAVGIATLSNSLRQDPLGGQISPAAGVASEGSDQLRARQLRELTERIAQNSRAVGTQPV